MTDKIITLAVVATVIIIIFKCKITFRVVDQCITIRIPFEEKVACPKIEVPVDIYSLNMAWKFLKDQSIGHIDQNIANSGEMPEKMSVVVKISNVVMNEKVCFISKFTDNMAIPRMKVVMLMKPVGVGMVSAVIIPPAVYIPAIALPCMIPVHVLPVIVISVKIFIPCVVMNMVPGIAA